ncbi:unnamed protein product, partial [Thlaspi arvense]
CISKQGYRRVVRHKTKSNMAKAHICLCFIIFLYLSREGSFASINNTESQGSWCVAKPAVENEKLFENIYLACAIIDCAIIYGGPCYLPDDLHNRASVAMNLYYQTQGRHFYDCDFEGSAIIAVTDPSYGDCKYEVR